MSATPPSDMEMEVETQDVQMLSVDDVATVQPTAKRVKLDNPNAEAAKMDRAEFVIPFPKKMPMENEYTASTYYVRRCYPQYYKVVMDLLGPDNAVNDSPDTDMGVMDFFDMDEVVSVLLDKAEAEADSRRKIRGVTVTGTPGIGKSVFMAYFFQRYSKDYPEATILLVSYNRQSELLKVAIAKGGKVCSVHRKGPAMEDAMVGSSESPGKDELWLLDGPPKKIPDAKRWVSFTSPNDNWMRMLAKNTATVAKVFMPVWKLNELRDAASKLGRTELLQAIDADQLQALKVDLADLSESNLSGAAIDVRYRIFGGVPRVCFASSAAVRYEFKELVHLISGMSMDELVEAMLAEYPSQQVHRLLRYVPLTYEWETVQIGSMEIKRRYAARQQEISEERWDWLERVASCRPLARVMLVLALETRTYDLLRSDCSLNATKLRGEGKDSLRIEIPRASDLHDITHTFELPGFDRTKTQVLTLSSKSLESIDGFCWIPRDKTRCDSVLLLQISVVQKYPVKAFGYLKVLEALGLWEEVQKSPHTAAALVFVVAQESRHSVTAQDMVATPTTDDAASISTVYGIRRTMVETLASLNIRTVGKLRKFDLDATDLPERTCTAVKKAKRTLKKQESGEDAVDDASLEVLQRIPQYVWKI